ncbi:hypothetical protein [Parageobacillus sp. KH3-4]|uniref:hypothetical protein n=1 Tax=Parageobacillus sp. KH3-4 TaxID=2916802 RepID=UPI001FCA9819|nr:hypothetical protein [Parageobacillus sp. KH3-4]BDG47173.1 hypothetical protein PspKH34_17340 [Parageobacillus sp. KH3-4]
MAKHCNEANGLDTHCSVHDCISCSFCDPVFSVSATIKVAIGGVALVMAEALFWLGVLLVGKETIQNYTKRLLKKREKE